MTARELYDTDPGFRGFLAVWDENRRCPLELVDYLLDRDMPAQAECARWAATEKDRSVYFPNSHVNEKNTDCGPYPTTESSMTKSPLWFWGIHNHNSHVVSKERLPTGNRLFGLMGNKTPIDAIIALMDAWLLPEGESAAEHSSSGLLTKQ